LPAQNRLLEVVESAAQPHASAWLQALPVVRMNQTMSAVEFQCRLKYNLLIPLYADGACCPQCSAVMDPWGDHAVQCRVGVGLANTFRHNAVWDCLLRMATELLLPIGKEPPLPVQVLGLSTRRPDLVVRDWDNGRDLYLDVVGTSPLALSYRESFTPGGARAAAQKVVSYREILRHQPARVILRPFAFDVFGGLHEEAVEFLSRLQGIVGQAQVSHEGLVWFSTVRRLSFTIARAVGRQLATRLPFGGDEFL
jgi:hypothetical protein